MTKFEEHIKAVIKEWANTEGFDEFLDFAEGMDISGFCIENGERVVYIANGLYNIADGYRIGENDGKEEKYIIEQLAECGIDFEEV